VNNVDLFKSSFPEDLYLPATAYENDYAQRVFFGYSEMKKNTVTIALLARNIGEIAEHVILRVSRLSKFFKSSKVVWLENGSIDDTRKILLSRAKKLKHIVLGDKKLDIWEQESNLKYMQILNTLPHQGDKSYERKYRMAMVRNLLRDNLLRNANDSDIYIVIDAEIPGGFSYEGIANSFSYQWDICTSNSLIYKDGHKYYYDSWAWRDLEHLAEHTDQEINPREYFRGDIPIEVTSAFGGLGIYKNIWYMNPLYRYNDTDCDHPTIHIPMWKDGAKIIMNPSQITLFNRTRYVV